MYHLGQHGGSGLSSVLPPCLCGFPPSFASVSSHSPKTCTSGTLSTLNLLCKSNLKINTNWNPLLKCCCILIQRFRSVCVSEEKCANIRESGAGHAILTYCYNTATIYCIYPWEHWRIIILTHGNIVGKQTTKWGLKTHSQNYLDTLQKHYPNKKQHWHQIIQSNRKQTLSRFLNGKQHLYPHTVVLNHHVLSPQSCRLQINRTT